MTPEDIGLDLDLDLPTCAACRKKSDGAKRMADGTILCGTHADEYLATLFPKSEIRRESPADFAKRLREGPFRTCWGAVPT